MRAFTGEDGGRPTTTESGCLEPQLGRSEQAIDDVGGTAHAVVDQRRLAVRADDEQWRRLALRQSRGKLDVDLDAVVEDADASRNAYVDLVEAGIIDPTKVVRIALENAVSVASVLLLTEATMTDLPEPKPEAPSAPDMSM